ncbi:MAG TPA: hypothetical protein VER79_07895 [Candidatus Limnocylindrales bacterium]|nr:hypothetical protein [Candidatus Limnocylindrales bacterium]
MSRTTSLERALYDVGLLQYGLFDHAGGVRPFQHQLAMLASYPDLLREAARGISGCVHGVDRLLCREDSVPLAVALALEAGLPLVIARGNGSAGPSDLVGAFDIGHPAALVALTLDDVSPVLLGNAHSFGLEVQFACALLEIRPLSPSIPAQALMCLPDVTARLVADKHLPAGLGRAVTAWLAAGATRPRPGSAAP